MTNLATASRSRTSAYSSSCLLLAALLGSFPATATGGEAGDLSPGLLSDLRNGGYVIYIRHASTEVDYADQVTADTGDCSTQRTLSEKGWQEAALIGAGLDLLSIPVGAVYSSDYCRAWQTAQIAFGRYIRRSELNFEPAEDYSPQQVAAMLERLLPLLKMDPAAGTNTVFVGHDDPFEAAMGVYPEPQGVTYILKKQSDGEMRLAGHVKPESWVSLLEYR